jgi:hypothetical protein
MHWRERSPVVALLVAGAFASGAGARDDVASSQRPANELGRIPILEYHAVGDTEGRWRRERDRFRADLELLYARGYRPVALSDLVDRTIDLPAGLSPVVITFDDADPSQLTYIESGSELTIDPRSAVGIMLDVARTHPGWHNRALFCVLTGADAGRSLFGAKGIDGQRTEWRHRKVRQLVQLGFEICGHTDWHANLEKVGGETVAGHIARGIMAIDSAVPGYRVRSFALPYGAWPANRALVRTGEWRDNRGRLVQYRFDAILEAWGGPVRSPFDPRFDPFQLTRIQVTGDALERVLDQLDAPGRRYVSDGDPRSVARLP